MRRPPPALPPPPPPPPPPSRRQHEPGLPPPPPPPLPPARPSPAGAAARRGAGGTQRPRSFFLLLLLHLLLFLLFLLGRRAEPLPSEPPGAAAGPAVLPGGHRLPPAAAPRRPGGRRPRRQPAQYFGNICCVSGDCRNTRSFQQQIFSDVKKRKTPCKCAFHIRVPVPGALPGEQLQHLRLGRAPRPPLGPRVVRGPQQAGQGQAGLQPPRPPPARLHTLLAPFPTAPPAAAGLHRHPAREEAATTSSATTTEENGSGHPTAAQPRPCQIPPQVSLRVAAPRGGCGGFLGRSGAQYPSPFPDGMDVGALAERSGCCCRGWGVRHRRCSAAAEGSHEGPPPRTCFLAPFSLVLLSTIIFVQELRPVTLKCQRVLELCWQ